MTIFFPIDTENQSLDVIEVDVVILVAFVFDVAIDDVVWFLYSTIQCRFNTFGD